MYDQLEHISLVKLIKETFPDSDFTLKYFKNKDMHELEVVSRGGDEVFMITTTDLRGYLTEMRGAFDEL